MGQRIGGSEAKKVCRRIGKKDLFSRRAWILWNRDEINLRVAHVEKHFIHLVVDAGGTRAWKLIAVCASPIPYKRPTIWEQLRSIRRTDPWPLIGDFNCMMRNSERNSKGEP